MGRHGTIDPIDAARDFADAHEAWLLRRPDQELLEIAIYRLPPNVLKALAGAARAYYSSTNDEYLDGALDDTRAEFEDEQRIARDYP